MNNIEVEVRGLLTELDYNNLINFLDINGSNKSVDNRKTVFFILEGKTLKVSNQISKGKAKIALKVGDIVKDTSQKEFELNIQPEQYELAIDLLKNLGFNKLQYTEQKRINYNFKDVEIAVKWSEDWGFHFEIDKVISENENDAETKTYLESISTELGLNLMSEEEFGRKCEEIDKKYL